MIEQCLSNKNENTILSKFEKFMDPNQSVIVYSLRLKKTDIFFCFDQSYLTVYFIQIFCANSKIDKSLLKYQILSPSTNKCTSHFLRSQTFLNLTRNISNNFNICMYK